MVLSKQNRLDTMENFAKPILLHYSNEAKPALQTTGLLVCFFSCPPPNIIGQIKFPHCRHGACSIQCFHHNESQLHFLEQRKKRRRKDANDCISHLRPEVTLLWQQQKRSEESCLYECKKVQFCQRPVRSPSIDRLPEIIKGRQQNTVLHLFYFFFFFLKEEEDKKY